jgi:integrase
MSVFRKPRSPYWHFDFQWRGHRFHGSTKCTTRREAEKVEAAEREKAKQVVAQSEAARTSLRLDDIAGRYWQEVGQHHAGAIGTEHRLELLIQFFGKDKLITEITSNDVAKLVAWRRGHQSPRTKTLISSHTVNHLTEQTRKLFTRAKLWGVRFQHEPHWSDHLLPTHVRVREVSGHEAELLDTGDDYGRVIAFARASGLRLEECLLKWSEVYWSEGQIIKRGKGDRLVPVWITSEIRDILLPLRGHDPVHVFTYVFDHGVRGRVKGKRYPITITGMQTYWKRLRQRTGLTDLRFHDLRHDFGTKLLRETGNLEIVRKAMNHRNIATTLRYAHVLDQEVRDGMERAAKSRTKSRSRHDWNDGLRRSSRAGVRVRSPQSPAAPHRQRTSRPPRAPRPGRATPRARARARPPGWRRLARAAAPTSSRRGSPSP